MALSDWADWWDTQKKESEAILEEWVQENPQWWAIGLATAASTSMELGAGMVDVLRLGQGAAEGGWGYGKDALRLLVVLGPLARAGGALSRVLHTGQIRVAVETAGVTGPCTFTAVNNALSIVGGRAKNLFLTARDAAKALGTPLRAVPKEAKTGLYEMAAWIDELVPFMVKHGARVKPLSGVTTVEQAAAAAASQNGVVVFAIKYTSTKGEAIYHSVIAVRDVAGKLRYGDYGGRLVGSLTELARNLGHPANAQGISLMTSPTTAGATLVKGLHLTGLLEHGTKVMKGGVLVLEGVHAVETPDGGVDLAYPVTGAVSPIPTTESQVPAEVVKQSFAAFKARKRGKPVSRLSAVKPTGLTAPRSDWLTGVQFRLNAAGFAAGPVDGIKGPQTDKAVRAFQAAYGLRVDGIPGPKTQAKLVEVCGY
jgi:hypothetical protein